jgi:hypothetical protein
MLSNRTSSTAAFCAVHFPHLLQHGAAGCPWIVLWIWCGTAEEEHKATRRPRHGSTEDDDPTTRASAVSPDPRTFRVPSVHEVYLPVTTEKL